jgi:hypothetical protein
MLVRPHLPGYRWFHVFRNAAIRTGVYVGVCLTLVFTAWLIVANRAPFLERFALERNIFALSLRFRSFGFCACQGFSWRRAFSVGSFSASAIARSA